ncbi:MAG TPA: PKD domain-containing protein [Rubricoccaceae bacterium]|nr:PKD domain-containing protein [Rubricoccaceae bacterium]
MLRPLALPYTVAALGVLLLAAAAQAQRAPGTLHVGLRTGATAYGGEYDGTSGAGADDNAGAAWMYRDFGVGLGAEFGYQLTRRLSGRMDLHFGRYANLDRADVFNPLTGTIGQRNDGEGVAQLQALLRFTPLPYARAVPYVQAGGALAFGQGDGAAYGPALGAGVEYAVTPRVAVFVEATGAMLFPDGAIDGFDPDGQGYESTDRVDYDALTQYGAGVRYTPRAAAGRALVAVDCPGPLGIGEDGAFTARTAGATGSPHWDFGDGVTTGEVTTTHAYMAAGTYTARFSARVRNRDASAECPVTVEAKGPPPAVDACAASPLRAAAEAPVAFGATVSGAAVVRWDFGDGHAADGAEAAHAYAEPGTYEATLTATGAGGTATCQVTVSVGTADEVFCEAVQTLAPAHFGFGMDALSINAREELAANVPALKRCPALCVRLDAFTDGTEGTPALAQRRAEAVRDFYLRSGIAPHRIAVRDGGVAPDANPSRDALPGDRAARRVESVPMTCPAPDGPGD